MTSPDPVTTAVEPTRSQTFARGTVAGVVARGITLLGPLVVVPLALAYLGGDRYGLWVAVTSLPAAALFADFGLGSGLLTTLTPLATSGDVRTARSVVATGVLMSAAASAALGLLGTAAAMLWTPASTMFPGASGGSAERRRRLRAGRDGGRLPGQHPAEPGLSRGGSPTRCSSPAARGRRRAPWRRW